MSTFLVIDDQSTSRKLISKLLEQVELGGKIFDFDGAEEALAWVRNNEVDLVLVDFRMPGMDGVAFTKAFRQIPQHRDVPVVMITISEEHDVRMEALEAGATDFLNKPLDHLELKARCTNLIKMRRHQTSVKERSIWLENRLAESSQTQDQKEFDTIQRLLRVVEKLGFYDLNYADRTEGMVKLICKHLKLEMQDSKLMPTAAVLNDIGMIFIPDHIINKPGSLSEDELHILKNHTEYGYDILKDSESRLLQLAAEVARYHHERLDGSGYPYGLSHDDIPMSARIMAVIDVFNALVHDRPHRKAWSFDEAFGHIEENAGKLFDKTCAAALLKEREAILELYEDYPDLGQSVSMP